MLRRAIRLIGWQKIKECNVFLRTGSCWTAKLFVCII